MHKPKSYPEPTHTVILLEMDVSAESIKHNKKQSIDYLEECFIQQSSSIFDELMKNGCIKVVHSRGVFSDYLNVKMAFYALRNVNQND